MGKPDHILYFVRNGQIGGSQKQLLYLIEGLDRTRYMPSFVCGHDGPFIQTLRQYGDVHVLAMPPWRTLKGLLFRHGAVAEILRIIQENAISLLHCSDAWLNPYMAAAAKESGLCSIVHVRAPLAGRTIRKLKCNQASAVISISRRSTQCLHQAGISPARITQIDDAVDLRIFKPDGPRASFAGHSTPDSINIGIVGRIDRGKKQLEFLMLAQRLLEHRNDLAFFIIGDFYDCAYYKKLQAFVNEHGIAEHLYFAGLRNDMADVMRSLDVLITFSGGSVMYEAMACGKVVISAGFTKRSDTVHVQHEKTGCLFETFAVEELRRMWPILPPMRRAVCT